MTRFRCFLLAALLAGSSTQCLLFTDTINVPPEVSLVAPSTVVRGQRAIFMAVASDKNQEAASLDFAWFVRDGAECPDSVATALSVVAVAQATSTSFDLQRTQQGPFCVWVVVTDHEKARAMASASLTVGNEPPVAALNVVDPLQSPGSADTVSLPLWTDLRVRGTGVDPEGDPTVLIWSTTVPPGQTPPMNCGAAPAVDSDVCVRLETAGEYHFALTAVEMNDDKLKSQPVSLTVVARPDAPPCITRTEPSAELDRIVKFALEEETSLDVLEVQDDGDPFPPRADRPSDTSFIWRFRLGHTGPFERYTNTSMTGLHFPKGQFRPGDELEVRVDVQDRVKDRDVSSCADAATCEAVPGSGCFQRVSWMVEYL